MPPLRAWRSAPRTRARLSRLSGQLHPSLRRAGAPRPSDAHGQRARPDRSAARAPGVAAGWGVDLGRCVGAAGRALRLPASEPLCGVERSAARLREGPGRGRRARTRPADDGTAGDGGGAQGLRVRAQEHASGLPHRRRADRTQGRLPGFRSRHDRHRPPARPAGALRERLHRPAPQRRTSRTSRRARRMPGSRCCFRRWAG